MKACVLHAIGDLRFEERPTPTPGQGEVLLRVGACGVCGSDIPRVFSKGTYRFPIIPGHEFAGTAIALGAHVDAKLKNQRVAVFPLIPCTECAACVAGAYAQCDRYDYLGSRSDGAFAEYVRVPAWNLIPLPDEVSMQEAAMVEPAAVALHALRRAGLDVGANVLIFGAGPIGLLVGMWARLWGAAKILLVDVDIERLRFARKLGFDHLLDGRTSDPAAWVHQKIGNGADLVVEASGAGPALEQALHAARTFGKVVLLGNPAGEMKLSQEAYWAILRKELQLSGSWNSCYGDHPRDEWKLVIDAMASGKLDVRPLITHRIGLDVLWELLQAVHERKTFSVKILVVNE